MRSILETQDTQLDWFETNGCKVYVVHPAETTPACLYFLASARLLDLGEALGLTEDCEEYIADGALSRDGEWTVRARLEGTFHSDIFQDLKAYAKKLMRIK